jgi:hypothetical protein
MAPEHRRYTEHKAEQIAAALVERFKIRRELNRRYATMPGGRIMFTVPLTDKQLWERWQNPKWRQETIDGITKDEGPAGVVKYIGHMAKIDDKLHRNGTK